MERILEEDSKFIKRGTNDSERKAILDIESIWITLPSKEAVENLQIYFDELEKNQNEVYKFILQENSNRVTLAREIATTYSRFPQVRR